MTKTETSLVEASAFEAKVKIQDFVIMEIGLFRYQSL
jgi:hypothetical protein